MGEGRRAKNMSTNERDLIVGGQAVIEGVMMRTPNAYAIAVRKADGTIRQHCGKLAEVERQVSDSQAADLCVAAQVLLQSMGLGYQSVELFRPGEAFR
jgi:uncharacterized protein YqhQ